MNAFYDSLKFTRLILHNWKHTIIFMLDGKVIIFLLYAQIQNLIVSFRSEIEAVLVAVIVFEN